MQTTMISASMTAYSTAVGPLSSLMKLTTAWVNLLMGISAFWKDKLCLVFGPDTLPGPDALTGPTASGWPRVTQLPLDTAVLSATLLNVLLALLPSVVMAAMQTTTMRASMTAYSTAV